MSKKMTCQKQYTKYAKLGTTLMFALRHKRRACLFFGLVDIARAKHPIPSRTRPLSAVAPMVLRLKTWESRSPPNLTRHNLSIRSQNISKPPLKYPFPIQKTGNTGAGWSSPVARQAHNLKAAGSNPAPATKISDKISKA